MEAKFAYFFVDLGTNQMSVFRVGRRPTQSAKEKLALTQNLLPSMIDINNLSMKEISDSPYTL